MLTVSRHLLAGADFTFGNTMTNEGLLQHLTLAHPGHTVTRATQLQYLTLGLGHTELGQGITHALNANRPGVTVQETRSNKLSLTWAPNT